VAANTTARKRSPKKSAPAPASEPPRRITEREFDAELAKLSADGEGPIGEDGTIRPVQIGKRGRTPNRLVTIFTLDGVDYQIPEKPSPAVLIKFLRESRNRKVGVRAATENLLVTLLGQEALDALAESPEVTEEDVADVFAIVAHVAFGAVNRLQAASDPS
jgi:hypothetical protein